jgi:hypothetical protein
MAKIPTKELFSPLVICLLSVVVTIFAGDRIREEITPSEIATLLPARYWSEIFALFILPLMVVMLVDLLFGRFILRMLLRITGWFREDKYEVAYVDYSRAFTGKRIIQRTLVPSYVSLGIGLSLGSAINARNLGVFEFSLIGNILITTLFSMVIVALLIFPIWVSEDCGLVFYRKGDLMKEGVNIAPVGDTFYNMLKGWAGIVTPLQYIVTIIKDYHLIFTDIHDLLNVVSLLVVPVILFGIYIPIQLVYLAFFERIRDRLHAQLQLPHIQVSIIRSS